MNSKVTLPSRSEGSGGWLRRCQAGAIALLLLLDIMVPVPSFASVPLPEPDPLDEASGLLSDQLAVRDLMRMETALALQEAEQKYLASRQLLKSPASLSADRGLTKSISRGLAAGPRLTAIYGVEHRLWAEVVIDGEKFLYLYGHTAPVGVRLADAAFRLKAISQHCVELENDVGTQSLCLNPRTLSGGG